MALPLPETRVWVAWAGTAYDRRLGARAAGIAFIAAVVSLLVIAATDEGGPWSPRFGMAAALAPIAGTLGALAAIRLAAARGELAALGAIGVEPTRAVLGAVGGGVVLGLVGPSLAALGIADLGGLFPRPPTTHAWIADGDGIREAALGLRVGTHGALALEPPVRAAARELTAAAGPLAIVTLAAAALVCPAWIAAAEGRSPARRAAVGALAVLCAIAAFQGVAAGRAPAGALLVAPLVLFIDAATARYHDGCKARRG